MTARALIHLISTFVVSMTIASAFSAEPRRMTAEDIAFNLDTLQGATVTVIDCILFQAQFDRAFCPILTKRGLAGVLNIGYSKDARGSRERAVNSCFRDEPKQECLVEVTGIVRKSVVGGVIGIDGATIKFRDDR